MWVGIAGIVQTMGAAVAWLQMSLRIGFSRFCSWRSSWCAVSERTHDPFHMPLLCSRPLTREQRARCGPAARRIPGRAHADDAQPGRVLIYLIYKKKAVISKNDGL